jgi:hypothetical protein
MSKDLEAGIIRVLRGLSDEAGALPDGTAAHVFRAGRRMRTRRTVTGTLISCAAALLVAVPLMTAVGGPASAPAGVTGPTTVTFEFAPTREAFSSIRTEDTKTALRDLLTRAHLPVKSVTAHGPNRVTVVVGGAVDRQRIAALLPLPSPDIRPVLDSVADAGTPTNAPVPVTVDGTPSREEIRDVLGPAWDVATSITDPRDLSAETLRALAPFATLTSDEVALLPVRMQFDVPTVTCAQLDARPARVDAGADGQMVACGHSDGTATKYLLGPVRVPAGEVTGAITRYEGSGLWMASLALTDAGQQAWTALTADIYHNYVADSHSTQVAIVIGGTVAAAPLILSMILDPPAFPVDGSSRSATDAVVARIDLGALRIESVIRGKP